MIHVTIHYKVFFLVYPISFEKGYFFFLRAGFYAVMVTNVDLMHNNAVYYI